MSQFYDSMTWVDVGSQALDLHFPPGVLGLVQLQRIAPRALTQSGTCTTPFQPSRSIVQGLGAGARFANCCARKAIQRVTQ
eukprot:9223911-Pyramimonas_sp.AAC.1